MWVHAQLLSHVRLFGIPWTVARPAPLSMEFSRQEYWSGLSFPTPGDLPNPETEPASLVSPALVGRFFTTEPAGRPNRVINKNKIFWHPNFCCKGKLFWRLNSNISAGLPLPYKSSLRATNSKRNLHIITKSNTDTHQTVSQFSYHFIEDIT